MASPTQRYVALLRGVNVGGKHKLPMATFREALAEAGFANVSTYIQSGNAIVSTSLAFSRVETQLVQVLSTRFALDVPVVVREAQAWSELMRANPFADEANSEPNRVQLLLSRAAPAAGVELALQPYAIHGERIVNTGDALWVHYPGGIRDSKLVPTVLDRCVGAPVTARNWRTVSKLQELLSR
ncbi:MAG: DUF1697 domain-containing protein [Pseudomonadota bacterium]